MHLKFSYLFNHELYHTRYQLCDKINEENSTKFVDKTFKISDRQNDIVVVQKISEAKFVECIFGLDYFNKFIEKEFKIELVNLD